MEQTTNGEENPNFKHYYKPFKKGIDDLISINPYSRPSAYDWATEDRYVGHFGITEQEYKLNPKVYEAKVRQYNEDYILKLVAEDEYGKTDYLKLSLMHNPAFDDPQIKLKSSSKESYKAVFIDLSNIKNGGIFDENGRRKA